MTAAVQVLFKHLKSLYLSVDDSASYFMEVNKHQIEMPS